MLYAHNFYIALYDDASGEVSFPYFADERRAAAPVARRGSRGYTEYTIRQRRPCIIDRHKARLLIERGEITPVEGTPEACSWLGIPLYDGKQVRGVLAVQSYREDVRYSQRDQELLTFVSRHIDTALSGAALRKPSSSRARPWRSGCRSAPGPWMRPMPDCCTRTITMP